MNLAALDAIKPVPLAKAYCRMVERSALESLSSPDFLHTKGNPGRYNPRGVHCLYCSEERAVSAMEYERYNVGKTTQSVMYWIHLDVAILDLGDPGILAALDLSPGALHANWMALSLPGPTLTQQLGQAISAQKRFAGIRYPSDAAKILNGFNGVFFRDAVVAPHRLIIKDDRGAEFQRWP